MSIMLALFVDATSWLNSILKEEAVGERIRFIRCPSERKIFLLSDSEVIVT